MSGVDRYPSAFSPLMQRSPNDRNLGVNHLGVGFECCIFGDDAPPPPPLPPCVPRNERDAAPPPPLALLPLYEFDKSLLDQDRNPQRYVTCVTPRCNAAEVYNASFHCTVGR